MFLFIRLLLAHCIADFPLQTNYIFRQKSKGILGVMPHALIVTLCCVLLSWPFLHIPAVWLFIAFIGITHLIQDSIKINYNNPKYHFWLYLLDQAMHVGMIAAVFLTSLKDLQAPPHQDNLFLKLYNNDALMIYLSAVIFSTYNGFFLIESFKISFKHAGEPQNVYEKWYGMAERACITSSFLVIHQVIPLLAIIVLVRPVFFSLAGKNLGLHASFMAPSEISLNLVIGGLCSSLFLLL